VKEKDDGGSVTEKKAEILHVGIDLGTSRSAVSASNGERHLVESYVGWPAAIRATSRRQAEVLLAVRPIGPNARSYPSSESPTRRRE
jgi:molecular chaperone DnaK (HSP70)